VLEAELGSGGFGVVYQALDRVRGQRVALKVLQRLGATELYRFKQEFRSLADLAHPNLVSLHELFCEDGRWFFTMELLQGESFLDHVRRDCASGEPLAGPPSSAEEATLPAGDVTLPLEGNEESSRRSVRRGGRLDLRRLRGALAQLVEGVAALHGAGKLHRDLKPANVMVTAEGRLVLLDFGLVSELSHDSTDSLICGTPHYMSPEMAGGRALGEAADWYSVGVMLFEALTGALPHSGSALDVMGRKQVEDPPAPVDLDPAVPADLSELCLALLAREPTRRPSTAALLEALAPEESPSARRAAAVQPVPLHGRAREQELLLGAAARVERGQTVLMHVFGPSGVGKSTLVQHVVEQLRRGAPGRRPFVALVGRCYEQESVPFEALDSLVDALCDHLRELGPEPVARLLPRHLSLLCRLFPVLSRASVVQAALAPAPSPELPPAEQRRRGVLALRELLARLGERAPLALILDDAQWGDEDSAEVFDHLLRPPDPPRLLLVACHRGEAASASASFVERLRAIPTGEPESARVELPLAELDLEASRALARTLLGSRSTATLAAEVAREGRGNPFLITTLARHLEESAPAEHDVLGEVSLEDALRTRLARLPEAARLLLELVCLAGVPVEERVVARAARRDDQGTLKLLRAAHLVRSLEGERSEALVPYHDRVRETVLGFVEPARRPALHAALAAALEDSGADPDLLATHLERAGEPMRAARYARLAATRARQALAFDRAAALLRRAMTLQASAPVEDVRAWQIELADTLVEGQRGAEAAPLYLAAAEGAALEQSLELRRRAAEQWLKSGHVEQGRPVLEEVLAAHGLALSRSPRRALLSLLRRRARLRLRGLGVTTKARVPGGEDLACLDLSWTGWIGLCMHDFVQAAELHTRGLLRALEVGEPARLARSLAMEAVIIATAGEHTLPRSTPVLERARALGAQVGSDHVLGLVELATGVCAYAQGQMHLIHDACVRAGQLLGSLPGAYWEQGMANLYAVEGLVHTGRMADLQRQLAGRIAEAEDRGDLFAALGMRVQGHLAHLAADDATLALEAVRRGMATYSAQTVRLPHYWEFYALGQIQLYCGEGRAALEEIDRRWGPLKRALLLRLQVARIGARYLRGRAALAAAGEERDRRRAADLLRVAARESRLLLKERSTMGRAKGRLVEAGVALAEGDAAAARAILTHAAEGFERLQMSHYALAARRRLAELTPGPEGREALARVDATMRERAVRDPARWTAMLAPGPYPG